MEQSTSGEANRFSANQDILRVLWNPKVHYHIHKSPPRVPVLKHLTSPCLHPLLEINLNVIPFKAWGFQMFSLPQIFSPKPCIRLPVPHVLHTPPPNLIFLDLFTLAILGQQYRTSRYAVFSNSPLPRHCYSQISSSAPCSQTPYELRASLYVRQSFTTCKIMYFLMYC